MSVDVSLPQTPPPIRGWRQRLPSAAPERVENPGLRPLHHTLWVRLRWGGVRHPVVPRRLRKPFIGSLHHLPAAQLKVDLSLSPYQPQPSPVGTLPRRSPESTLGPRLPSPARPRLPPAERSAPPLRTPAWRGEPERRHCSRHRRPLPHLVDEGPAPLRVLPVGCQQVSEAALPLYLHGASPGALRWPNPHCPLRSTYRAWSRLPTGSRPLSLQLLARGPH